MVSLQPGQVETQSVITKRVKACFVLDVTGIVPQFDEYEKGDVEKTDNVQFGNLQINTWFYPKGNDSKEANPTKCSLYFHADEVVVEDTAIQTTVECGTKSRTFKGLVSHYAGKGGYGIKNFCKVSHLAAHPVINITMEMRYGSDYVNAETVSHEAQQQVEAMYKYNRMDGDVTLLVVASDDGVVNDIDATLSHEPPLKKRKLNENQSSHEAHDHHDQKDNEIKASAILLKSSSPVFESILSNDSMEKKEKQINVISDSVQNVDDMVYFMCTNKLRDKSNALQLIKLAHFYQMERFKLACIDRMIETLSVDNFVDTVNIFDRFTIKKGFTELISFGKAHVAELRNAGNLDELPFLFRMSAFGQYYENDQH
mmetsp:Transcript_51886/g.85909  ORF Transcript_51886/g.85909 Transcript_51886/m.85909 type:complete len:370 (-) Transcript_51886:31-1140(-)